MAREDSGVKNPATWTALIVIALLAAIAFGVGCNGATSEEESEQTPLKLGLILNFTGSPETSENRERAFKLAILHINEAGGVFGMPVTGVSTDATGDPDTAAREAQRLIDEEGVHAIVGPNASSASLPISQTVSATRRIPTVSPSATSPQLTNADDDGYFFRTALSDVAQGPVLARITHQQGFDNVGLIYQDDAYGTGLAQAFAASWNGAQRAVAVDPEQREFAAALSDSAIENPQALIVIASEQLALALVRQAIDSGTYNNFVFADSAKRLSLPQEIGADAMAGMYGTGSARAPHSTASEAWDNSYIAEYGELPVLAYVKETYDATIAIALAAQAAGTVDGEAVRDQLRAIAGPPGQSIPGTADGVADALAMLADGEDVDYDGTSGVMEWDEHGDLARGYTGVWRFTSDGGIEDLESIPYGG